MKVVSFYRFLDLEDPQCFRDELQALCEQQDLLGTMLVASEGFNGTIAGSEEAMLPCCSPGCASASRLSGELDARWTEADEAPFRRMRVKVKKEIVTLGRPDILPHTEYR